MKNAITNDRAETVQNFRKMHYNIETVVNLYRKTCEGNPEDTVKLIVEKLGYEDAVITVAEIVNTVSDWDERISRRNREWAKNIESAAGGDELLSLHIYTPFHPAHIDQIADQMRKF